MTEEMEWIAIRHNVPVRKRDTKAELVESFERVRIDPSLFTFMTAPVGEVTLYHER